MTVTEVAKTHNWNLPTKCPRCGAELIINSSGFPECPNEKCIAKVEHQFARFFDILGIKAAGPAFIANAAKECSKYQKPFASLLQIASNNNCNVSHFNEYAGGINGEKILTQLKEYIWCKNGLKEPKPVTAAQFCAMFDYPHLSVKQFEKIPEFNLNDVLSNISYGELKGVDGIGDELAEQITTFLTYYHDQLEEISHYFNFNAVKEETNEDLPTVCFTGACPGHSRNELAEMCKGKYNVVNSVTKDLDILACADPNSGSSKLQKAAKNGTKVISYDELLSILGGK